MPMVLAIKSLTAAQVAASRWPPGKPIALLQALDVVDLCERCLGC